MESVCVVLLCSAVVVLAAHMCFTLLLVLDQLITQCVNAVCLATHTQLHLVNTAVL